MTTTSPGPTAAEARATALLIDFGGVLTAPIGPAFGALAADAGLAPDAALRLLATHEGARTARVPVALVSNSLGRDCYARVDLEELFDVSVVSGQVGVRKPSREIYRIACERLGVEPADCVLVDDLEHNLVGAARLGIRGILHRSADESLPRIREALRLPAPTGTR